MKRKIYLLFVILLAITVIPIGANAKTNNFIADDNVSINEDIPATSFIAGNNVEVSSFIDGAAFIAGQHLRLGSQQDVLFAGGNTINVKGATSKEVYVAGNYVEISDSIIRDLYVAASSIKLNSSVERDAYLKADNVIINSTVNGDLTIAAESIELGDKAVIEGTLKMPKEANIKISKQAIIKEEELYVADINKKDDSIVDTFMDKLIAFLSMLVIGLILLIIKGKAFEKISKMKKDPISILKDIGIGFCFLVIVPVAAIIVMFTLVGIPLSIIALLIYAIMIYLSLIPTAYFLGELILKDKISNKYLEFTLVLLVIYILKAIPIIGGLISFLGICLGLGIYLKLIKENK